MSNKAVATIKTPEYSKFRMEYTAYVSQGFHPLSIYYGRGATPLKAITDAASKIDISKFDIVFPKGYYFTGIEDAGVKEVSYDPSLL